MFGTPIATFGPFPLGRDGDEDEEKEARPPEREAELLRERWAELNAEHPGMGPGDVVIYKVGLDPRSKSRTNVPFLLTGDDPEDYSDSLNLARARIGRADTVCYVLHPDGTGLPFLTDRRYLEPWPRAGGDPVVGGRTDGRFRLHSHGLGSNWIYDFFDGEAMLEHGETSSPQEIEERFEAFKRARLEKEAAGEGVNGIGDGWEPGHPFERGAG